MCFVLFSNRLEYYLNQGPTRTPVKLSERTGYLTELNLQDMGPWVKLTDQTYLYRFWHVRCWVTNYRKPELVFLARTCNIRGHICHLASLSARGECNVAAHNASSVLQTYRIYQTLKHHWPAEVKSLNLQNDSAPRRAKLLRQEIVASEDRYQSFYYYLVSTQRLPYSYNHHFCHLNSESCTEFREIFS